MFNKRFILEKSQTKASKARKLLLASPSKPTKGTPEKARRRRAEITMLCRWMNLPLKQKATLVDVTIVAIIVTTAVIIVTDVTTVAVETGTDATTEIIRSIKTTFLAWDELHLNIEWEKEQRT